MKIIFIDRDGTLIVEPPKTFQVNSLDELEFLPYAISSLQKLYKAGYTLVLITNQDGLGTEANPTENYDLINNKIIQTLKNEGVEFLEIFTCPHFEADNCECRKPRTGMVNQFIRENKIDSENSYIIGDRETDMQFAKNIGVEGMTIKNLTGLNPTWQSITKYILEKPRTAQVKRKTKETDIFISINLDGEGKYKVDTGLKFFDHMLEQLGKHGSFDLEVSCKGDLEIDEHHTIEDTALALGECFTKALGNKIGIERYAHQQLKGEEIEIIEKILPMDEALSMVAIDLSGRGMLEFSADLKREYVGDFPTEMLQHFYESFCAKAGVNMNMGIFGENTHHMVEVSFKSFARCLKEAVRVSGEGVSSTKGVL